MAERNSYGWYGLWELICEIFKKRLIKVLFLGMALTVVGVIASSYQSAIAAYISPNIVKIVTNILIAFGTALIAASAVGYIFADEDYTNLLEKDIVNVLFNPSNYQNDSQLLDRWREITKAILDKALPFENQRASDKIAEQFLTEERDYHFEGVDCLFEFDVCPDSGIVQIKQTVTCSLVITPNKQEPVLVQNFSVEDSGDLTPSELQLNGRYLNIEELVQKDSNNRKAYTLKYPLSEFIQNCDGQKVVKYKRVVNFEQNLADDPSFSTYISRYVKGYRVEASISDGYKLLFSSFLGSSIRDFEREELPNGRVGWTLCALDDLLLPGEAFILTISKEGG